jgi:uncharacterized cupredoxin-like copper-binding protein
MKKCVAGLFLSLAASVASAHGDMSHAKTTFNAAETEQKEFGIAGDPAKVARTIELAMTDNMRFTPNRLKVRQGDTVKFVVTNKGTTLHEIILGTARDLKEHAEMMKKFPDMEHDEPHMAHVKPGTSGEIIWTFNQPGTFDYACLIAGHFEAGMIGKITVSKR